MALGVTLTWQPVPRYLVKHYSGNVGMFLDDSKILVDQLSTTDGPT